jgi:tRNA threonylcarbamoyladenosine modification (KEOPS) complex  Pcc1 subunit
LTREKNLEITILIEISFASRKLLNAIMDSLRPDNVRAPHGLSVDMEDNGELLVIKISCHSGIATLINTVDEILEHISIAKAVLCND